MGGGILVMNSWTMAIIGQPGVPVRLDMGRAKDMVT